MDVKKETGWMLDTIRGYGVDDNAVFRAMKAVPRHFFVPDNMKENSYGDFPLPIPGGQTISQPYTVAFMLSILKLEKGQNVLEIGAGSGWNIALIKHIIGKDGKATSIEYNKDAFAFAKDNLENNAVRATLIHGDGSFGYPLLAPYDRIIVTAACPEIPRPLLEQLNVSGILVAPVGRLVQTMTRITADKGDMTAESLGSFRFVPLLGKHGFGMPNNLL